MYIVPTSKQTHARTHTHKRIEFSFDSIAFKRAHHSCHLRTISYEFMLWLVVLNVRINTDNFYLQFSYDHYIRLLCVCLLIGFRLTALAFGALFTIYH